MSTIKLYGSRAAALVNAPTDGSIPFPEITDLKVLESSKNVFAIEYQSDGSIYTEALGGQLSYFDNGELNPSSQIQGYISGTNDGEQALEIEFNNSVDASLLTLQNWEGYNQFISEVFADDNILSGSEDGGSVIATMLGGDDYVELFSGELNDVNGNAGADEINLFGGEGMIRGGRDNDSISIVEGSYSVYGNKGDDYIENFSLGVNDGISIAYGGKGDDVIVNFGGAMAAYGDLGSDTFVPWQTSEEGLMRIYDFEVGVDTLNLSNLDISNTAILKAENDNGKLVDSLFIGAGPYDELAVVVVGVTSL
jgi:hypothetical protein